MFKKNRLKKKEKATEKSDLNSVSQRHLDYYEENIKDLEDKKVTPDKVTNVFEVSKSQKKEKKARRTWKREKK